MILLTLILKANKKYTIFYFYVCKLPFLSSGKNKICVKFYLFPNIIEFIPNLASEYSITQGYYWYVKTIMTIFNLLSFFPEKKHRKIKDYKQEFH